MSAVGGASLDDAAMPARASRGFPAGALVWALAGLAALGIWLARERVEWAVEYPRAWVLPLKSWISAFMKWLVNDATFGLFTFKEFTRSIAWLLDWPLTAASGLLANGLTFSADPSADVLLPALSWLGVVLLAGLAGRAARDWKLGLFTGGCFAYLAVFGQWQSAMITLSSILIAVPLGVALGLAVGIAGFRSAAVRRVVAPLLDLMQTVPVFAYLVPVLFLFGFGPVAAMIATIIYATPPMVRVTMLALSQVPEEIVEFGRMAGCSRRQMLWKVLIPTARPSLMVGVNQVIMMSLNMVIIASMIGAGGLGFDVLSSLRRLAIGNGLEAGIAITLLAIALDRLSQAWSPRPPPAHAEAADAWWKRHPLTLAALALVLASWIASALMPSLATYPEAWQVTTGAFWERLVEFINVNFFDQIEAVKTFLLIHLLVPVKRFMLEVPWAAAVLLLAVAGWRLGGWRLGLLCASLALFIAVTRQWEKAMITVYLCGISVLIAALLGIPIGIAAARNERLHRVVQAGVDTLQTLPSFVYLIPVVMLFRVGDFSAMIAIVAYAIAPAIRYTDHGIRRVPAELVEAARAMGCTRGQILRRVQLPLAAPEIMLGINQTIMMALAMLVITALVGTRDLGQEVYIALTKADTGRGIVAGLCVAFIAIIADRLIGAWATRRKRALGLA